MNPNISVLFCDDIRHEVSGKISLIGVYGSHLIVNEFPAVLTKLCVHMTITIPKNALPEAVVVKFSYIGNELLSTTIPVSNDTNEADPKFNYVKVVGGFEVNQLNLDKNGVIDVSVEYDDVYMNDAKLYVYDRATFETDVKPFRYQEK